MQRKIELKAALDNFDQASKETGLKCTDKSLAQQHFAEECDINTIVERFHLTGEVPQLPELPSFQIFEDVFDFQTAMNTVRQAQETFMAMPADLRARFDNDPQKFLTWTSNKDNIDEAEKLGMLSREAIERRAAAKAAAAAAKENEIIEKHEKTRSAGKADKSAT